MNVTLNTNWGMVSLVMNLLAYMTIAYFAIKLYRKQTIKPSVWKLFIVIIIGLSSFSFEWTVANTLLKLSILPLGVWLLYFICKGNKRRWQKYRLYAWLGFGANYIFLAAALITIPLQSVIYPNDKPSTYFANINDASLITIHPSADSDLFIDIPQLEQQLAHMQKAKIDSQGWYLTTHDMKVNEQEAVEKFPYMLLDVKGKWGSGYHSLIYIENDGKGILITNNNNQYYYRFEHSIIAEVKSDHVN